MLSWKALQRDGGERCTRLTRTQGPPPLGTVFSGCALALLCRSLLFPDAPTRIAQHTAHLPPLTSRARPARCRGDRTGLLPGGLGTHGQVHCECRPPVKALGSRQTERGSDAQVLHVEPGVCPGPETLKNVWSLFLQKSLCKP